MAADDRAAASRRYPLAVNSVIRNPEWGCGVWGVLVVAEATTYSAVRDPMGRSGFGSFFSAAEATELHVGRTCAPDVLCPTHPPNCKSGTPRTPGVVAAAPCSARWLGLGSDAVCARDTGAGHHSVDRPVPSYVIGRHENARTGRLADFARLRPSQGSVFSRSSASRTAERKAPRAM